MLPSPLSQLRRAVSILVLISLLPVGGVSARRPGDSPAAFSRLDLYANIETVGVTASGSGLPEAAQLMYRQSGESAWRTGHPLMRIPDGRLVGSLFGLTESTAYDIRVIAGGSEISGSVTTQPEALVFTPAAVLHVDASAPAGGDGSPSAPFRTIQEGVNHAVPGTQVLVADGIYHEEVSFPASGSAANWIQVKAQGSGAIVDGSQNRTGSIWTPTGTSHVYFTTVTGPVSYLARDQQRFYAYDDLASLNKGMGHGKTPMSEGWVFEALTMRLYIRSLDDPAGHSWQIPTLSRAFQATGREWLWIEGFEMRFYGAFTSGCGVCTTNASHVVIRDNRIHGMQLGIFINWNGSDSQGNDTRIENNEIYDPPVNEWPWKAVKGSSMEGTAIVVRGRTGAIVRGNELHNFFNGIYTGSSAALENPALAFDADIYNNHIHHIGDDAFEPEGACINHRFRNNTLDSVFVGYSLAPVTQGPTWILHSLLTHYTGRAFKWDRNSDGFVLIYQNTIWSTAAGIPAMDMISPVHHATTRNNIFQSSGYGVYEVATGSTGHDWNHDNWYITRTGAHFKWENVLYSHVTDLCNATGLECSGFEALPGFVNPGGGDFSLQPTSPNVDRGVLLPGINDAFVGNAPDIGAFEFDGNFTISGNAGMGGVMLSYNDGGPRTVTTDANGSYSITVLYGWSGTVTPSRTGFTFIPASRTYSYLAADQTHQDYIPGWVGAVSVESDRNIAAVGRPHVGDQVMAYGGAAAGGLKVLVPMLFKNAWGSYNSAFYVQNLDPTHSAAIRMEYHDSTGHLDCTTTDTVEPLASKGYWVPGQGCLPDGWVGGVIVTSDQPVAAVGRPHVGAQVMTYNGFEAGSTRSYLPMLFKNAWGSYDAAFYVQNADDTEKANLTIQYIDSAGTATCTRQDSLLPLASKGYWVPAEACLPDGWVGGAVVSSNVNIVTVGRPHIGAQVTAYSGSSNGSTSVYLPMLFRKAFGGAYDSAFYVQNVDELPASITIHYYSSDGSPACSVDDTIEPLASKGYWLPGQSCLPDGWVGAAVITSDRNIAAVGRPHVGSEVLTYNGQAAGSLKAHLPMLFRAAFDGSYNSAVYVQNTDPGIPANITLRLYDMSGILACTVTDTLPARAARGYWLPLLVCEP